LGIDKEAIMRAMEQTRTATEREKTSAGDEIVRVYSKRAARYNITAHMYYLMGVRVDRYRKRTVEALRLRRGDRVLDLACGTGANFSWLEQAVGPQGHILGLDLTAAMLSEARKRIQKNRWTNIELLQADATNFTFPEPLDGVICSYAISLMPSFGSVIQKSATALKHGGRMGILDVRYQGGSGVLNTILDVLVKPFGSSDEVLQRRPWEEMPKYLTGVELMELYFGFLYIAVGTKVSPSGGRVTSP
jgi:ubiquinone/menaquinone biosynthesis C-methylase UbiE